MNIVKTSTDRLNLNMLQNVANQIYQIYCVGFTEEKGVMRMEILAAKKTLAIHRILC